MALALPGSRNVFSALQLTLASRVGGRIALNKGVHHALEDFCWMLDNISFWFPSLTVTPQVWFTSLPLVWHLQWPNYITDLLVTDDNPSGTISNSDLELAGGLLHLEAVSRAFDIRE